MLRYRKTHRHFQTLVAPLKQIEQLDNQKSKLGQKTVFCSRARATNARAFVLEQAGATNH